MKPSLFLSVLVSLGLSSCAQAQQLPLEYRAHPFYAFDSADGYTADIALADVDGDGDLDALTANGRHWAQQDYVYFNSGDGRMLEAAPIGDRLSASYILGPGDFDKDGDIDLVVVRDNLPAQLYLNDGKGNYSFEKNIKGTGGPARSAVVLDANGDGALDIAIVSRRGADIIVFGDGTGGFTSDDALPGDGIGSTGIAAADMDDDGDIDLVIARRDGQQSILMTNSGAGKYQAKALEGSIGDHRKSVIADFDQDGLKDIILLSTSGSHTLYKTTRGTDFSGVSKFGETGREVKSMAAADLDGDGDIDLVEGTKTINAVYINAGDGVFQRQELQGAPANTYGVTIGDMNGDNKLDIVFANSGAFNSVMTAK